MNRYSLRWLQLWGVFGLAGVALLLVLDWGGLPHVAAQLAHAPANSEHPSYLYRYDPLTHSFLTITLASNAMPIGLAVTGTQPADIWVAEYGLNQITRVTFTSTVDYALTTYPLTSTPNNRPARIAVHGNEVWFTQPGANRIGRLNALSGELQEFYDHGLPPNAGLSDIKVTPDHTVWIGAPGAQSLLRLTVNSPDDYTFAVITDVLRPGFEVAPAFLAVTDDGEVWLTMRKTSARQVAHFTPATQAFVWPTMPAGSQLEGVAAAGGYAWYADPGRHMIDQVQYETWPRINSFGPITRPREIAAAGPAEFWVTQDDGRGSLGHFVYTSTVSFEIASWPLPVARLQLGGIAATSDGGVWIAAYVPKSVYLPFVARNP
jgi:streptogramin lyase